MAWSIRLAKPASMKQQMSIRRMTFSS